MYIFFTFSWTLYLNDTWNNNIKHALLNNGIAFPKLQAMCVVFEIKIITKHFNLWVTRKLR